MKSFGYLAAIFHDHHGPLGGQELVQGNPEDFVITLGIGASGKILTGGVMDTQCPHFHIRNTEVISVFD